MKKPATIRQITWGLTLVVFYYLAGCAHGPQAKSISCDNNLDSTIPNFCQVTPDVLWRGAKPDKNGAAWLVQQGVRTVVNLELLHDDQETFEELRLDDTGKYQIGYYRIRDWEPLPAIAPELSDKRVAQFLAIMQQAPKPVYVHCRSGENRTGLMVAAYRVIVGGEGNDAAIDAAIDEMASYQGFWFETDAKYIRGLTPQRRAAIRKQAEQWLPRLKQDARFLCEHGECRSVRE